MSEWKICKLGEIAETRKEQVVSNGVEQPYIGLEHIEQQSLRLNGIGSSKDVVSNKFKFYSGDILYGRLRPYFRKVYQPNFDGVCSTEIFVIKAKTGIDKDYLFYLVASDEFTNIANSGSSGTHMPRADWKQLEKSEWNIPDLATQSEISQILTSLDQKIKINLEMNVILEAMAQAQFKEWFENFNFPGFDGKLENGLPKGWRKTKIADNFHVTDFVANGSFASLAENVQYKNEPDFAVLIRLTDYNRGFNGDYIYLSEHSYNFLNKSKLFGDEIIIANVGANAGDVFRAPFLNRPMSLGPNAIMIKNNDASNFLYLYLKSELGQHSLKSIIAGSAQPKFNKTDFRQIELIFPTNTVLNLFNEVYNSINQKLLANKSQIHTLTQTRDTLLPKLMSGKIELV